VPPLLDAESAFQALAMVRRERLTMVSEVNIRQPERAPIRVRLPASYARRILG